MIELPPGLARRFQTVAAKCVSGRPLGPPPEVVCRARDGTLTVSAGLSPGGVSLTHTGPTPCWCSR